MYDCHADVTAYHNKDVTLPKDERDTMRDRRDTNRTRLKDGLKRDDKPKPVGCHTQGSYAMRTMVQHAESDYDIDDGVYFAKEDLVGPQGGVMTAAAAKEMVRKAVHDDKFKKVPEVRNKCVRVYYDAGYHVDIPVYRRFVESGVFSYELAATDWKVSDALEVTRWFTDQNEEQSPDLANGGQLRRMVRLIKAFARSRPSWRDQIATGFMITKLVSESFNANSDREDKSLRSTMRAIHMRLQGNLVIKHPVLNEILTNGTEDAKAKFLRTKLEWASGELEGLDERGCTQEDARAIWDRVFYTTFFRDRGPAKKAEVSAAAILKGEGAFAAEREAVDRRGGGRFG